MSHTTEIKSDEELVRLTLQDKKHFIFLVQRYEESLSRFIRRKALLSKEDIEDLLQDIFIKIYINLNDFDESFKFSSWAYRIAYNETISWYRKKHIRPQINFEDHDEESFLNNLRAENSVENDYFKEELKNVVGTALTKINPKYKDILVLRYLEEKEYTEISDILQIPTGTVSTLIHRGKVELKEQLKKYATQ